MIQSFSSGSSLKIVLTCHHSVVDPPMADSEVRNFEIVSDEDELTESNRQIWKLLGIKQGETALFFPAPNALVPLMFARFMNKRKVTFVDTNEVSVSTLIKLAAQMKLSNVTVKLASPQGKFPVPDNTFDVSYSDWGLSYFTTHASKASDSEILAKELVRVAKSGGKVAALEENGTPVMYPCPPEILAIRSKIDSTRADRLIMGRRVYSLFRANNVKKISMHGFSNFLTGEMQEKMGAELKRKINSIESTKDIVSSLGVAPQDIDKYTAWLKSQIGNQSFLIQFNSILTIGEK
jgi:ubiquinone/menaquinone biosynthesis C-methylase UbiE